MLSFTEENYLKALLQLSIDAGKANYEAGTNELASRLGVKPATVNDMLKRLKEKKLIHYEKYGKITLAAEGKRKAVEILRKHRLWETFLYDKLDFNWDEVHEVAEQLEHIQSAKLVEKLDKYLGFPEYDPHGDPIPDKNGVIKTLHKKVLADITPGVTCRMVAVKDSSAAFLKYLNHLGLGLQSKIKVVHVHEFDHSLQIEINKKEHTVSQLFAQNIFVV